MNKTLIRPADIYGHEAWTMLGEDMQALEVLEWLIFNKLEGIRMLF